MVKVGVIGASGRMGSQVCATVAAADDLELAARIGSDGSLDPLMDVDVAVDFTHPGVVMDHITWCIEHGVSVVAGTSGFTDERIRSIEESLSGRGDVGVMVVPNFSIGAVLMMKFAAEAARFYESVEIVELHHPMKKDAPSGTARRTAEMIAAARKEAGAPPIPDATADLVEGARGATVDGVSVHSLRIRGLIAHQEVVLGSAGETLTIRHDSLDRESFMPGVLAAVRAVQDRPGITIGLEHVVGLA